MAPKAFESAGPLVEGPDCFGVGAVKHSATVAAYVNQAHVAEHAEVLGDGGLLQTQALHNGTDRPFLQGEKIENVSPAGFGDGVEGVGGGSCSGHESNYIPIWVYVKTR